MSKHNKQRRNPKPCNTCGRASEMPMCSSCADELHALLIGGHTHFGQPGIVWYISRLVEQAYGQSRLGSIDSAHGSDDGYALLIDERCTELLARIRAVLGDWVACFDGLAATWANETGQVAMVTRPGHSEPLEARYARWLAGHIKLIRRHQDSRRLFDALSSFAKESWRVINRPADVCCGPCTTWFKGPPGQEDLKQQCGTMLYADENASTVKCSRCRTKYDVEVLRNAMRDKLKDMLFTGAELRRLMETRLNDRIPKATFYRLIADGRLEPRKFRRANKKTEPLFTYADVVQAREKPVPVQHSRAKVSQKGNTGNGQSRGHLGANAKDEKACATDGLP